MRLDSDNYPTEDILEQIRQWKGTANALLDAVIDIWPHYGTTTDSTVRGGSTRRVVLVTGGWSGCEDLVDALRTTLVWTLAWSESSSGGRHVLELPHALAGFDLTPMVRPTRHVRGDVRQLVDAAAVGGGMSRQQARALISRIYAAPRL